MKKLFMLFATLAMLCAVGCEEQGDDDVNPNDKPNTEQPSDKPNDGGDNENDSNDKPNTEEPSDPNPLANLTCAPNEILYTTKYGLPIELGNTSGFGGNLVYNTYENGVGRLTFGNDVTTIPERAFEGCNSMEYIKFPDSVTWIGPLAFSECESLVEFNGKFASSDGRCLIIDGVLKFFAPAGLTEYTILDSVTSIGYYAFAGCTSLTSVTIPDSVTSIGQRAFWNCSSLASINIPDGVTSIGDYAFSGCSSLASITIPNSVTSIGKYAFNGCTGALILNNKKMVEYNYFKNKNLMDTWFANSSFTSIVIGGNITSIGSYAFNKYESLPSINIPDSVTSIGSYAFADCSSLASVTIGNGVTSIGEWAFRYCTSLTSITIPDSVTSIGDCAFYDCKSLGSVYCKPTTPPKGGYGMFYIIVSVNIVLAPYFYVPIESVEAYKAAYGWSNYASSIVGYDFE